MSENLIVTHGGGCIVADETNATTKKRNTQSLEFWSIQLEIPEDRDRYWTGNSNRTFVSSMEYDPSRNTVDEVRLIEKSIESAQVHVLFVLDGIEYFTFNCLIMRGETLAFYEHVNVCKLCNRLFFLRSTWWCASDNVRHETRKSHHKRFCGDDCRIAYHKNLFTKKRSESRKDARQTAVATCQHCGSIFSAKRSDALYCSPKCRVAANRATKIGGAS